MQLLELVFVVIVFALFLFLVVGSYILQRDRYWNRIWRNMGEPQIDSVNELRSLVKDKSRL